MNEAEKARTVINKVKSQASGLTPDELTKSVEDFAYGVALEVVADNAKAGRERFMMALGMESVPNARQLDVDHPAVAKAISNVVQRLKDQGFIILDENGTGRYDNLANNQIRFYIEVPLA